MGHDTSLCRRPIYKKGFSLSNGPKYANLPTTARHDGLQPSSRFLLAFPLAQVLVHLSPGALVALQ